jgi:hypothetical protein
VAAGSIAVGKWASLFIRVTAELQGQIDGLRRSISDA